MKQNTNKLKRQINFLTIYTIISSIFFGVIIFTLLKKKENIDEISLKRLNVIEEDGSLRMVISNETRQHSGRGSGEDFEHRERPAGILFFNDYGDECGGIIAETKTKNNVTRSGMSFTMDNYHNDQVIQILNSEEYKDGKATIQRGISINEFPVGVDGLQTSKKWKEIKKIENLEERRAKELELWEKEGSKKRLFVGRNVNNESGLFINDTKGKAKLKIYVDETGNPKIVAIDSLGNEKDIINKK